jgi:hypothetical protein
MEECPAKPARGPSSSCHLTRPELHALWSACNRDIYHPAFGVSFVAQMGEDGVGFRIVCRRCGLPIRDHDDAPAVVLHFAEVAQTSPATEVREHAARERFHPNPDEGIVSAHEPSHVDALASSAYPTAVTRHEVYAIPCSKTAWTPPTRTTANARRAKSRSCMAKAVRSTRRLLPITQLAVMFVILVLLSVALVKPFLSFTVGVLGQGVVLRGSICVSGVNNEDKGFRSHPWYCYDAARTTSDGFNGIVLPFRLTIAATAMACVAFVSHVVEWALGPKGAIKTGIQVYHAMLSITVTALAASAVNWTRDYRNQGDLGARISQQYHLKLVATPGAPRDVTYETGFNCAIAAAVFASLTATCSVVAVCLHWRVPGDEMSASSSEDTDEGWPSCRCPTTQRSTQHRLIHGLRLVIVGGVALALCIASQNTPLAESDNLVYWTWWLCDAHTGICVDSAAVPYTRAGLMENPPWLCHDAKTAHARLQVVTAYVCLGIVCVGILRIAAVGLGRLHAVLHLAFVMIGFICSLTATGIAETFVDNSCADTASPFANAPDGGATSKGGIALGYLVAALTVGEAVGYVMYCCRSALSVPMDLDDDSDTPDAAAGGSREVARDVSIEMTMSCGIIAPVEAPMDGRQARATVHGRAHTRRGIPPSHSPNAVEHSARAATPVDASPYLATTGTRAGHPKDDGADTNNHNVDDVEPVGPVDGGPGTAAAGVPQLEASNHSTSTGSPTSARAFTFRQRPAASQRPRPPADDLPRCPETFTKTRTDAPPSLTPASTGLHMHGNGLNDAKTPGNGEEASGESMVHDASRAPAEALDMTPAESATAAPCPDSAPRDDMPMPVLARAANTASSDSLHTCDIEAVELDESV